MLTKRDPRIPLIMAALLMAMLGAAPAAQAKAPALVILQAPTGTKLKPTPIRDQIGKFPSPVTGKPQSSWILAGGDARASPNPPPDRLVRLYHAVDNQLLLLCTLVVKYSLYDNKWIPAYRIEERFVLMHNDKQPLPSGMGDIDLAVMTGPELADANGFYRRLEFSLSSRPVTIDAWEVQ